MIYASTSNWYACSILEHRKGTIVKLRFIYQPVEDFSAALAFYRDTLGWEEAWREGEGTAAFRIPGNEVQVLLDKDPRERQVSGPMFLVDSVDEFHRQNAGKVHFLIEPHDIPPGRYCAFEDVAGNVIRVIDNSKDN
jgi:catechol 2,3-dioxygenase-like lactoylglutathione lyase family enzyme